MHFSFFKNALFVFAIIIHDSEILHDARVRLSRTALAQQRPRVVQSTQAGVRRTAGFMAQRPRQAHIAGGAMDALCGNAERQAGRIPHISRHSLLAGQNTLQDLFFGSNLAPRPREGLCRLLSSPGYRQRRGRSVRRHMVSACSGAEETAPCHCG